MSNDQTSQSQHDNAVNDQARAGFDAWAELARQGIEHWTAAWGKLADIEARVHEQGAHMLEESARLSAETVKYALELARESRRMAVEAARRAADLWTPA
jgi:hypothetical protein